MKRSLAAFLALIVVLLLIVFGSRHFIKDPAAAIAALSHDSPSSLEDESPSNIVAPRTTTNIVDDSAVHVVGSGSSREEIVIALDEAVVRDAQGKESVVRLQPIATFDTLAKRLSEMSAPRGVFPVAYLKDQPRSVATRRLITRDLRLQADEALVQRLVQRYGMTVKDRPSYAPGWAILSAQDPFAALAAMGLLREQEGLATADVLLASQRALRAMPNDPLIGDQWHYKNSSSARTHMNIENAWKFGATGGVRGAGIRIGIVDDGLQTAHPDLSPNVDTLNDKDWNDGDNDPNPGAGDDHGTACAGNAAAEGNNALGVSGSAPDATLVGMRLIAASVTDAQEAEAMSYLPSLISILSNSWGPNDTGDVVEEPGPLTKAALQTAVTTGRGGKGSIILWAAGNGGDVGDNSNYDGYANSIYTIAIGATDSAGTRAYYSEPGSNVVVCAPSSGDLGITTVDRTGTNGYNTVSTANGGDYTNDFGGTSSATPSAAGVVALLLEKNSNLGWRDVQEILIRSAYKFDPTDSGWVNNGAGFPFHHDYGAGLIDANAAVNLAATWTNLPTQTSVVSAQSALSVAIPENNATGINRTFDLSSSNLRIEQVRVKVNINHTSRGNLAITLTSPSGMVSRLTEVHTDSNNNFSEWSMSSVRHWGESSTGTWTLNIADRSAASNTTGGTLTSAELSVFGTTNAPVNPAPTIQITQPTNDQIFSPGANVTVLVSASDLNASGAAGSITQVQLYDLDQLVATDTTAPYSFSFTPSVGSHALIAKATDTEGAVGTSVSVNFSVVNQSPTISAVTLSAVDQVYADVPLTVNGVTAADPENTSLSYTYQWQSSNQGTSYTDVNSATTATAPVMVGHLLRCVVTASDGNSQSAPFTSAAVTMLARPVTSAAAGTAYSYASGLVLRGSQSTLTRAAMIHEFSQGTGTSEWVELLTLQAGSFRNWSLADSSTARLTFANSAVWDIIPAGTVIVIYNGASKDPLLPSDDADPADGKMVLSSSNTSFFSGTTPTWASLGNSGDAIVLRDQADAIVSQVSYGNHSTYQPNVGAVSTGKSAYFSGTQESEANRSSQWVVTSSLVARSVRPRVATSLPIFYGGSWSTLPAGFTGSGLGTYATSLGGDTNTGSVKFDDPLDSLVIEFSAQAASLAYQIKGNPASGTSTAGTFLIEQSADGTSYSTLRTITNATNVDTAYTDVPAAATRWIRFTYANKTAGNIQLDKLSITAAVANAISLQVNPSTFSEAAGVTAATATVTVPAAVSSNLVVSLVSSDLSEATVPSTVTILSGQSSATFAVTAVDDSDIDGAQSVTLTATAATYTDGTSTISVTDNEVGLEGVTPGAGNTVANIAFISALRSGSFNASALYRFGASAQVPAGLSIDPATGVISGTIAAATPAGNYLIVIERYNSFNEVVSQSFTLAVSASTNLFSQWMSSFPNAQQAGVAADADGDGLANGLENVFGSRPDQSSVGLVQVAGHAGSLTFEHTLSNTPAVDLSLTYEWSSDLHQWHGSGVSSGGTTVTFSSLLLSDVNAPANDVVRVTAQATGTVLSKLYARARVSQQ